MMPNQVVTVRRWEVVGAFLLLLASSISVAVWNDHRIDAAEDRITRNTVATARLAAKNEAQDAVRRELLATLTEADRLACARIEQLKAQNRMDARREFEQLDATLELLGLEATPAIVARAREDLARSLERNRAFVCSP